MVVIVACGRVFECVRGCVGAGGRSCVPDLVAVEVARIPEAQMPAVGGSDDSPASVACSNGSLPGYSERAGQPGKSQVWDCAAVSPCDASMQEEGTSIGREKRGRTGKTGRLPRQRISATGRGYDVDSNGASK